MAEPSPPRRRPQFTLAGMLGVMAVVSVALAPAYYLMQGERGGRGMQLVGIIFLLTAPMGLVVLVSVIIMLLRWTNRR